MEKIIFTQNVDIFKKLLQCSAQCKYSFFRVAYHLFNRLFNRHYAVEDAHWRMNDGGISSGLSFT